MEIEGLKKIIKENRWWSEEAPCCFLYSPWMRSYLDQGDYFGTKLLSLGIYILKNEFVYEETLVAEKERLTNYIFKNQLENRQFLANFKTNWDKIRTAIDQNFNPHSDECTKADSCWQKLAEWHQIHWRQFIFGCFIESIDVYTDGDLLEETMRELKIAENEARKVDSILSSPEILSYLEEGQLQILRIAWEKKRGGEEAEINRGINQLVEEYSYIRVNYLQAPMADRRYFAGLIMEEARKDNFILREEIIKLETKVSRLRQEKKEITQKYRLQGDLSEKFAIIAELGAWMDERKRLMQKSVLMIDLYLSQLARHLAEEKDSLRFYFIDELKQLVVSGKKIADDEIRRRQDKSMVVYYRQDNKIKRKLFFNNDVEACFNLFFPKSTSLCLSGPVASKAGERIVGEAQIILDIYKQNFLPGKILVTTMTRPEFVPIMRQAKAIITDEGGLTCHAAIVARELGIPCLIGTRRATKIFRTGDKLEIDFNQGKVKKIE